MEISDFKIAASLLCKGWKYNTSRVEEINGKKRVFFDLVGKSEKEWQQDVDDFFRYNLSVDAKTFGEKTDFLNEVIASHGIRKVKHQLEQGFLEIGD